MSSVPSSGEYPPTPPSDNDLLRMEWLRRVIHIGSIAIAFLFAFPGFPLWAALVIAYGAVFFNGVLMPRLGQGFYRGDEPRYTGGVLFYPLAVAGLITVFWGFLGRPEVAASGWSLMAVGDGAANVAGRRWGSKRLPWNPRKSWAGLAAFLAAAIPVASVLLWWVSHREGPVLPPSRALLAAAVSALPCSVLETLPWRLDDNLPVSFAGGGILYAMIVLG